jgi:hypothetical protein
MIIPWWIYVVIGFILFMIGILILKESYTYGEIGIAPFFVGLFLIVGAFIFKGCYYTEGIDEKILAEDTYHRFMIDYDEMLELDEEHYVRRDYIREVQQFNTSIQKYEVWNNNFWVGDFINDDIYKNCKKIDLGAFG